MRTGVYTGRFQPFHDGHKKCVEHILSECEKCIIIVRCGPKSEKNPFGFEERVEMIRKHFTEDQVSIFPLEDDGSEMSVYIGRDVGYELIQLDEQTEKISATDLRKKLYGEAGKTYDPDAPKKVK